MHHDLLLRMTGAVTGHIGAKWSDSVKEVERAKVGEAEFLHK